MKMMMNVEKVLTKSKSCFFFQTAGLVRNLFKQPKLSSDLYDILEYTYVQCIKLAQNSKVRKLSHLWWIPKQCWERQNKLDHVSTSLCTNPQKWLRHFFMIYSMLYTSGSTVVKSTVFRISEQTGSGYNKDVHHPSKNYQVGLMPSARLEVWGSFRTV